MGGVDAAGGLPRPAPALRQPARQAVVRPRPRGARRRRRAALARGPAPQRQQRVGGRRRAHGQRLPADRRRPAPHHREPRRLPADPAARATSSTSSASRSRACPASSTSPTPATSRGRSPTRWPTTRTCTPSGCGAWTAGWRRWARTAGSRPPPGSRRSRCCGGGAARGRGRDDRPRAGVLRERRRGRRAQPARRRRRCWATSASTRSCRCCAPAPSTTSTRAFDALGGAGQQRGDRRPARRACATASPAGCRCATSATGRASSDAADPRTAWTGWLDPLPRADVPPDGQVVTANERRGPESEPIGTTFAPPHRARRLHDLLDGRDDLTAGGLRRASTATRCCPTSTRCVALLDRPSPARPGRPVRERDPRAGTGGWMPTPRAPRRSPRGARPSSAGSLWSRCSRPLAEPVTDDPVLAPWLDPTARIGCAVEALLAAGHAVRDRPRRGSPPPPSTTPPATRETWGETHVLTPIHAFDVLGARPRRTGGARVARLRRHRLRALHRLAARPRPTTCWRGSVARYVWDLADRDTSGWVVPLGALRRPARARTTTTSSRCGPTPGWRRSSPTGTG